jgi:hypothetical protein
MSDAHDATPPPPVLSALEPDEELRVDTRAGDLSLVLTDRRVVIADDREITLNFPYQRFRRVEINVERGRPHMNGDQPALVGSFDRATFRHGETPRGEREGSSAGRGRSRG